MPTLVQIPWQPSLWLAPSTLARLQDASRRLGRNIYLNNLTDAAWRSYDQQLRLFIAAGRDPKKANDPDRGARVHMRGAGVDVPTDPATRQAMIDAGFIPDANEKWHFSDPAWAFMPIIKTNTNSASSGAVPIVIPKELMNTFIIVPLAGEGGLQAVQSLITGNYAGIQNTDHLELLRRAQKEDGTDAMFRSQVEIIHSYLSTINASLFAAPAASPTLSDAQVTSLATAVAAKIVIPTPTIHFPTKIEGTLS